MKPAVHRSAIVFGMCVMCVALFSGCANHIDPRRVPMSTQDLNHFQVDCRIKSQQVAMLQSMRQTRDEQFASSMRSTFRPFSWTSDHDIAYNNPNKYIDFHINQLSYCQ